MSTAQTTTKVSGGSERLKVGRRSTLTFPSKSQVDIIVTSTCGIKCSTRSVNASTERA